MTKLVSKVHTHSIHRRPGGDYNKSNIAVRNTRQTIQVTVGFNSDDNDAGFFDHKSEASYRPLSKVPDLSDFFGDMLRFVYITNLYTEQLKGLSLSTNRFIYQEPGFEPLRSGFLNFQFQTLLQSQVLTKLQPLNILFGLCKQIFR